MTETPTEKVYLWDEETRQIVIGPKPEVTFTPTAEKPSMIPVSGCTCDGPDPTYGSHREWCGHEPARWKKNQGATS